MPRCPVCRSAHITIVISLFPEAFCSACGARWIQDGSEQRAVTRESSFRPRAVTRPVDLLDR
jgi:hypothetical protein